MSAGRACSHNTKCNCGAIVAGAKSLRNNGITLVIWEKVCHFFAPAQNLVSIVERFPLTLVSHLSYYLVRHGNTQAY